MRLMRRFATLIAASAVGLAAPVVPAIGMGTASASGPPEVNGGTIVPMTTIYRRCDFSEALTVGPKGDGRGVANISSAGSNAVSAEVRLEAAWPNTLYNVRLIQAPRPSSLSCTVDTVSAGLQTDANGTGVVTLQDSVRPGSTGAWVAIGGPPLRANIVGEIYTSDFIAAI